MESPDGNNVRTKNLKFLKAKTCFKSFRCGLIKFLMIDFESHTNTYLVKHRLVLNLVSNFGMYFDRTPRNGGKKQRSAFEPRKL